MSLYIISVYLFLYLDVFLMQCFSLLLSNFGLKYAIGPYINWSNSILNVSKNRVSKLFPLCFILVNFKDIGIQNCTVCWPIVGNLRKPLGNGGIGNSRVGRLRNSRRRDLSNLERMCEGFWAGSLVSSMLGLWWQMVRWLTVWHGGDFLLWANVKRQLASN